MRADRAASPILTPKSLRRRRLSLVAFLLGLGSVILSLSVAVISLLQNRDAAEQAYLKNTRNEVRMLATVVDYGRKETDEQLLNVICDRWVQAGHWNRDPDEHFLIVNNRDSEVILDTAWAVNSPTSASPGKACQTRRIASAYDSSSGGGVEYRLLTALISDCSTADA